MNVLKSRKLFSLGVACALLLSTCATKVQADLTAAGTFQGHVGLSVDAMGSNLTPVGQIQAEIPVGATVLQAYLYAAGTPFPWYADSPTTLAHYNGAGITLAGSPVTNFSKLVGAVSDRLDIGQWYTGRADVTTLVQGLVAADPLSPSHSWTYDEGLALNARIDGGVLAVVYELASLPESSVVLLDGGQRTGGETSIFAYADPLGDPTDAGFFMDMSLAISFSCCGNQVSQIDVNGQRISSSAGNLDDGLISSDGSLITAGGVGDSNANPADPNSTVQALDDELYDLRPFVSQGQNFLTVFSRNDTNDDNIFFLGLHATAMIDVVPEPTSLAIALMVLSAVGLHRRVRRMA